MKINKFLPLAILFFFFNSAGLSYGLTYTTLLTPFFYYWIVVKQKTEPLSPFLLLLIPFIIAHLLQQVDVRVYLVSLLNIICVYIFCYAFYVFLKENHTLELIFRKLLYINFILCLVAIPIYFLPVHNLFWIDQYLTEGFNEFRRFKMFTYEASHYATLFIPLFFFFFLQLMFKRNRIPTSSLVAMMLLPLLMSFSLGVIGAAFFSIMITWALYGRTLTRKKRIFQFIFSAVVSLFFGTIFLFIFFPSNPLFVRIVNILSGVDSSGNGRTIDAFILAEKLLDLRNPFWGVGLGQIKIMGADTIRNFYHYDLDYIISIPNATAETLAIFGWIGLSVRIFVEIFLFFYTGVWRNYYRLLLFLFVFVYQFTGSYITNLAEYVIWILAFSSVFPQFDVKRSAKMQVADDSKAVASIQ